MIRAFFFSYPPTLLIKKNVVIASSIKRDAMSMSYRTRALRCPTGLLHQTEHVVDTVLYIIYRQTSREY